MRIGITGLPGTGKTQVANTLSKYLDLEVQHTDAYKHMLWEEQPVAAMDKLLPACIIEGVTVARMLKRGFNPDVLIYLVGPGRGVRSMPWLQTYVRLYEESAVGRVVRMSQLPTDLTLMNVMTRVTDDILRA